MKTCERCGDSGAVIEYLPYSREPKLCPCVTEKISKLERVAEAAGLAVRDSKAGQIPHYFLLSGALAALDDLSPKPENIDTSSGYVDGGDT